MNGKYAVDTVQLPQFEGVFLEPLLRVDECLDVQFGGERTGRGTVLRLSLSLEAGLGGVVILSVAEKFHLE